MQTLLDRHLTRPFAKYIGLLSNRVRDLNEQLGSPAMLDQHPGRIIPFAYSRMFGPIDLTTPRRYDNAANNGFEKLATVAAPGAFITPRAKGNFRTNRGGLFRWESATLNSYISWTWSSNVDIVGFDFKAFSSVADIFDSAVDNNGGAMLMNNNRFVDLSFSSSCEDTPNASYELGLYDKTRNRYLHDGTRLPSALFSGQAFINRNTAEPLAMPANTEIEPQLYVNTVRIRDVLNTDTLFNACQFRLYVHLSLLGSIEQVGG